MSILIYTDLTGSLQTRRDLSFSYIWLKHLKNNVLDTYLLGEESYGMQLSENYEMLQE